jgi:diphthamide synthase (EF-2-diphthine--ammonia ligase)
VKILVSWSTGKDSAWMLHTINREYPGAAAGLLTTTNEAFDRVAMHAVRRELLEAQAEAARLPLHVVPLPWPSSNAQYESIMKTAIDGFVAGGFTHVAFGDLFLADIRRYREERLAGTGLTPLFPLFDADDTATTRLAAEMIAAGLRARITCLDPTVISREFAGREFDARLLADLPASIDPCGERGEFHTCAYAGPMFNRPLTLETGITVERDGFVFTDVLLPAPMTT